MGETIGTRIDKLRDAHDQTQQQLADSIGVSRELVKAWIRGSRRVQIDDIIKLAKHFNVSADYLLGGDVPKSKDPDIQMICAYTGLSETAVEVLHYASHPEDNRDSPFQDLFDESLLSFINRALESFSYDNDFGWGMDEGIGILSLMEQYVTIIGTDIDGIERLPVAIYYGNKKIQVYTGVWEILKREMLARIEKYLDNMREEYNNPSPPKKPRKRKTTGSQNNG